MNYFFATKNDRNGFTLIELILYISIVAIIMSALIPFSWNIIEGGVKSSTQEEVSSAARYVSERIKYEVRNAKGLNTSDFDINLATNPTKKLSLLEDSPNDPTLIDVSGGKVRIKQGASTVVELNSQDTTITNLTFTNYTSADNKTKNVGFTLTMIYNYTGSRNELKQTVTIKSSAEIRSN